ncbi:MAG: hypothetical protein EHM49_04390 [Deltaproteobacteria bacterium]|nr:MAG: hypothetical protein EHM49_04390 [Deltaproteobacteria bacterium]
MSSAEQDLLYVGDQIKHRWDLFQKSQDIVDEKFEDGREYAQAAYQTAQETIQRLSDLASQLNNIDVDLTIEDLTPPSIDDFMGTPPGSPPDIELNMPADLTEADDVNTAIRNKLLHDITEGSPAIPEDIETAIFGRENERALLVHQDTLDKISAEWSKRGFTLPDGLLAALLTQAQIDFANKRLDVSRDVAIKSFELSDANTKFAIEKGIAWYAMRIETYKAKVQAEISRIDAIVKLYLGEAQVYQATAQVYTALTDAKVKKFEVQVKMALTRAELLIKDAELDMKNYEIMNSLKIEAMKAISGVAAQLVAGALSSVSASAHISATNSASYSYSPPADTSIND